MKLETFILVKSINKLVCIFPIILESSGVKKKNRKWEYQGSYSLRHLQPDYIAPYLLFVEIHICNLKARIIHHFYIDNYTLICR